MKNSTLVINSRSEAAIIAKDVLHNNSNFSKLMYGGSNAYFVCIAEMILSEILFIVSKKFQTENTINAAIALTRQDGWTLQSMFSNSQGVPGALKDASEIEKSKPLLDIAFYTEEIPDKLIQEIERQLNHLYRKQLVIDDEEDLLTEDKIDDMLRVIEEETQFIASSPSNGNNCDIPQDPLRKINVIPPGCFRS